MQVLPGPTKSNTVLAWSPDSRFLVAAGSGDGVSVWDVAAGTSRRPLLQKAHGGRLMQFCPRTGKLYVAFQSGGFWHWDPTTDEEHQHDWSHAYHQFYGMAVSNDGRTVVLHVYRESHRELLCYAVDDTGAMSEAWSREDTQWDERGGAFRFRPGTEELFGIGRHVESELRFVWMRPETGKVVGSFFIHEGHLLKNWSLAPDGERVAWWTEGGVFLRRLNDPTMLECPVTEDKIHRGLAFHPNGQMLAFTSGKTVRLLTADTLSEIRTLDWQTGDARAVAFSPDGLRCAVSGGGGRGWVTVFDVE